MQNQPIQLYKASKEEIENSNIQEYIQWLHDEKELHFSEYSELYQWSINHLEDFWESLLVYFDINFSGKYNQVIQAPKDGGMIGTNWFNGIKLSYAEHIFKNKTKERPALKVQSETSDLRSISWQELEDKVASVYTFLKGQCQISIGDRIVAVLPNQEEAVMAFLAGNALGAIWSSCSPDFGADSIVDRFSQVEPRVLFICSSYSYNGKVYDKSNLIQELIDKITTLEKVVVVGETSLKHPKIISWEEILSVPKKTIEFTRVPFSHPIWILYSSGTTGKPKAITHGTGGNLLEHYKALILHQEVKQGDCFFWYSTTGWMMWNYALSSLLAGATLLLYDGSAGYPDLNCLWKFVETTKATHFGAGAGLFIQCMKENIEPKKFNLSHLRSIGSTGSPLTPDAFEWIYDSVKKDIWLVSLSGGTDVCSAFVGGNILSPVFKGEIQCRMLGCAIEAYDENGNSMEDELGELVITQPMPSMPVKFWNDERNKRYYDSYFSMYHNIWRHGDWIKITPRKSVIIYGRSDATLNRGGVRIGTGEVYNAVDSISEVKDSMIVCLDLENGKQIMPLFVEMHEKNSLTDDLQHKIKREIRSQCSPRHVPDLILEVKEIPYTLSGKKMETPIKKILMDIPPEKAVSKDAMKNPNSIHDFLRFKDTLFE